MTSATTFLWFNDQAEAAAEFYAATIDECTLGDVSRPQGPGTAALTASFSVAGQDYVGLNGGPHYTLTPAVSIQLVCPDQATVDRYWEALAADGGHHDRCGWLTDRFGLSWQVIPDRLPELMGDPDPVRAQRVNAALMEMGRIDLAALEAAAQGRTAAQG